MVDDADPRSAAVRRLKAKRGFMQNLASYVIVNVFLIIVWAASGAGYFWPIWVIGGWGIGLASHAWAVYGRKGITEADIEREMQRGGDMIE
jgi:hypothetical protein